jgi:serine/threonine protein kinase
MKAWLSATRAAISGSAKQAKEMTVDDFQLMHTIGKGSFGKVLQVKKKDSGQIFAMKVLNKKNIIDNNEVGVTHNRRFFFSFLFTFSMVTWFTQKNFLTPRASLSL